MEIQCTELTPRAVFSGGGGEVVTLWEIPNTKIQIPNSKIRSPKVKAVFDLGFLGIWILDLGTLNLEP